MCKSTHSQSSRSSVKPWRPSILHLGALLALLGALAAPAAAPAAQAKADSLAPVTVSSLSPSEVEGLLASAPLEDLPSAQLAQVLSQLPPLGILPEGVRSTALQKAIEGLAANEATLGQMLGSNALLSEMETELSSLLPFGQLLSLLKGHSLSGALSEALGSVSARGLVGDMLGSTEDPAQLIEQVLGGSDPQALETLTGGELPQAPFSVSTVGDLADQSGTSVESLATDFETTSSQLPPDAMALTAPLPKGKTLGVLDALDGIDVGTLESPEQNEGEGSGDESGDSAEGGAGESSNGGSGGSGGSSGGGPGGAGGNAQGAGGTPGNTTIVVNTPGQAAAARAAAKAAAGKVKILSHKVKGKVVTLLVQVPSAGRLTVTGRGVSSVSGQADGAQRLTVRVPLTKSAVASLRKRRRNMPVKLQVSFAAVGGTRSSASTTVTFA